VSGINWQDSLIAHHTYASWAPQKLDQLVSTYLDSSPWKIKFGRRGGSENLPDPEHMAPEDLTHYNAADCRVTIKAWRALQGDLASELALYEHDLMLAQMCVDMSRVGIGVDLPRRRTLHRKLRERADELQDQMRALLKWSEFVPSKVQTHVPRALFSILKVPKRFFSEKTGTPSTDKRVIESLRGDPDSKAGKFAELLSGWRECKKSNSTYLSLSSDSKDKSKWGDLIFQISSEDPPNRVHYQWGARESRKRKGSESGGHTVSGRLASRFQSVPKYNPKHTPDRIREIYIPAPGNVFVYFDVKQGEPRVAAYLSADPVRILGTRGDVHANNAKIMFPDVAARGWLDGDAMKDPLRGKPMRDLAKNMGLAIDYFAEEERVHAYLAQHRYDPISGKALYGLLSINAVAAIIAKIRFTYKVYVAFVNANLAAVRKQGYLRGYISNRIRWLGWHAPITDVANYPIQELLASVMNLRTLALVRPADFLRWRLKYPERAERVSLPRVLPRLPKGCQLIGQVHDSCIFDCPKKEARGAQEILAEVWAGGIDLPGGKLVLPIDQKVGERFSEL